MGSNEISFNLYNLLRQPKNLKTAQKILSILEKISDESSRVPKFLEKFLSFLNLPKFFA
jgi:hypothetical protein